MTATLAELRKQPHWSFSSISTFVNICSLQWAFRYVYRAEPQFTSPALVFGKVFHSACSVTAQVAAGCRRLPDRSWRLSRV
jgi:hypothetical protein